MLTSKITSKGQITLPKVVRDRLKLKTGDVLTYEFADGSAVIRKVAPVDLAWHSAVSSTLTEWSTPEDEEAFRDL